MDYNVLEFLVKLEVNWNKYYYMENKTHKQRFEYDIINAIKMITRQLMNDWEHRNSKELYYRTINEGYINTYLKQIKRALKILKEM